MSFVVIPIVAAAGLALLGRKKSKTAGPGENRGAAGASALPPPTMATMQPDGSEQLTPEAVAWLEPALRGSGAWPIAAPSGALAAAMLGPVVSQPSGDRAPSTAQDWIARQLAAGYAVGLAKTLPPWPNATQQIPGALVAIFPGHAPMLTGTGGFWILARPVPFGSTAQPAAGPFSPIAPPPGMTTPVPGFVPGFPAPSGPSAPGAPMAPVAPSPVGLPPDAPPEFGALPEPAAAATYAAWKGATADQCEAAAAALDAAGYPAAAQVLRTRAAELRAKGAAAAVLGGTPYEIRSGDTGYGLAQRFTGKGGRWREILEANPTLTTYTDSKGATQIKPWAPGQTILLPAAWAVTPSIASAPAPKKAKPAK